MRVKLVMRLMVAALLAAALGGCGEEESNLYILRWELPWDTMQVGATNTLTVQLSREVTSKTYVDIANPRRECVLVGEQKTGSETLTYQPGEQEKNVSIKALTAENCLSEITLTFTLRDSGKARDFSFAIEN